MSRMCFHNRDGVPYYCFHRAPRLCYSIPLKSQLTAKKWLVQRLRSDYIIRRTMSVVPPNRSSTGWPRGVNQFGNKYISQPAKPLTLERTINLWVECTAANDVQLLFFHNECSTISYSFLFERALTFVNTPSCLLLFGCVTIHWVRLIQPPCSVVWSLIRESGILRAVSIAESFLKISAVHLENQGASILTMLPNVKYVSQITNVTHNDTW